MLFDATITIFIMVSLINCMLFLPYMSRNNKIFLKLVVIASGFCTYLLGIFTWNKSIDSIGLIRFADSHILFLLIISVFFLEFNYLLQFLLGVVHIVIILMLDFIINGTVTLTFLPEVMYIIILYTFCTLCIEKEKEEYSRSIFIKKEEGESFYKYINSLLDGMTTGVISIKINTINKCQSVIYKNRSYDDILTDLDLLMKMQTSSIVNNTEREILLNMEGSNITDNFSNLKTFDCKILFNIYRLLLKFRANRPR